MNIIVWRAISVLHARTPQKEFKRSYDVVFSFYDILSLYENSIETR